MRKRALVEKRLIWSVLVSAGIWIVDSGFCGNKLLPFQGYLTSADGKSIDGARLLQFRIYDAPVGGKAVWAGEVQRLSVNAGMVNTILGSKNSLDTVNFGETCYLEITVDANGDNIIDAADPPLLPRQIVLPSVFAREAEDSRLLQGYDWSLLFGNQEPGKGRLSFDILAKEIQDRLLPVGTVASFAGSAERVPDGWFICDGSALSGLDFPELSSCIGTHYGTGVSASTGARFAAVADRSDFNLPDLRGLFVRGHDPLGLHDPEGKQRSLGSRQNPATGLPLNNFRGVASGETDLTGAHRHAYKIRAEVLGDPGGQIANGAASAGDVRNILSSQDGNHTHTFRGEVKIDGGGDVETRPLNRALNFIIKY